MKHIVMLAAILLTPSAIMADTLVTKGGKKIEWRTIRDKGDSLELEGADGQVQVVQKKDIERVEFSDVKPALTGASFAFEGKTKTIDLLPRVDPKRDVVFGVVKYSGAALSVGSDVDAPTLLRIPAKLPEEYDLLVTVERKSLIGNFYVGLVAAGKSFLVEFDGHSGSLSTMYGGPTQRGAVLEKSSQKAVLIQVRRGGVSVLVDKKELMSFQGSPAALHVPDQFKLPKDEVSLFLGAQRIYGNAENAAFIVHRVALTSRP